MSSGEIRKHLELLDDKSLKIKRLLYTYTIGLLQIPSQYKDSVKAALEGDEFYITGYDTVWREARNLRRREQEYADYDDVFNIDEHIQFIYAAIEDAVDEIETLLISYLQETFAVTIKPKSVPSHDIYLLVDAVYAVFTGRTRR